MSYKQNNPFSRKSSPLNKDDKWIQKATESIKERGTEGVCTGDKFGGPTCPPGSKRYNLAKTFKKMAKDRKGGPSRESSEEEYMPIEDDMHKRGEGDMGMSRKPYGGNKGDEKRSVRDYEGVSRQPYGGNKGDEERSKRDYEGVSRQPYGGNKGDEKKSVRDYEGPSRKSSSPLNQGVTGFGRTGNAIMDARRTLHDMENYASDDYGYEQAPGYTGQIYSWNPEAEIESGREDVRLKTIHRDLREGFGLDARGHTEDIDRHTTALDEREGPPRKSSSPLNNTGMTGLNYSKELRYNAVDDITQGKGEADYGFSRESSSPLDYGSWAHEDATRAKDLYKKGDYAHARALGIDEHDADYAKHWHKDEAEHGPSRKSRSERLRSRAMKRSERSGAEWGDYDYEDKRVQKMLSKASKLDERSGKEMKMTMTKNIKPLPKKKA